MWGRITSVVGLGAALAVGMAPGCGPSGSEVAMSQGIAKQQAGGHRAAAPHYREALRLKADQRGALNNLAAAALSENQTQASLTLLEEELRRHPSMEEAQFNRALILLELGRGADALAMTQGAMGREKSPADRALWTLLNGFALQATGATFEAVYTNLKPLLAGADATPELRIMAQELLLEGARARGEPADLRVALDGLTGSRAVLVQAESAFAAQAFEQAIQILNGAPEAQTPDGRLLLAFAYWAQGKSADATAALNAGEPGPKFVHPHHQRAALRLRATIAAEAGLWPDALSALDEAMALGVGAGAEDVSLQLDRAIALAQTGNIAEARQFLALVLAERPDDPRAMALQAALK